MNDEKLIRRYYKKGFHKGRTALSRAVDFAAIRVIMLAAAYLWFSSLLESAGMAIALGITATLFASVAAELIKTIRMERFIERERKKLAAKLFRERLVRLTGAEFRELVRGYIEDNVSAFSPNCMVWPLQKAAPASEDDVLSACRAARKRKLSSIAVFAASSVSQEAKAIAARCEGMDFRFITAEELTAHGEARSLLPGDEDIDEAIISTMKREEQSRKKRLTEPFAKNRMGRYLSVAMGLFVLSFFVEYANYFRLLSAACLSFGAIAWWLNNVAPEPV